MDHSEAVTTRAAERYLLGELTQAETGSFEEHYFDCAVCAKDVESTAAFIDNSRESLQRDFPARAADRAGTSTKWFPWLQPAFATFATAAIVLLGTTLYLTSVTLPGLRREVAELQAPRVLSPPVTLQSETRGEPSMIETAVGSNVSVAIEIPPGKSYQSYFCRILDSTGTTIWPPHLCGDGTRDTIEIMLPAKLPSNGPYRLVVSGKNQPDAREEQVTGEPFRIRYHSEGATNAK